MNGAKEENNAIVGVSFFTMQKSFTKEGTKWCIDSGASSHMCNDRELFSNLDENIMAMRVFVGHGTKV